MALLVLTTAGFAFIMYMIADKSCASDRFSIICNSSETAVISTIFLGLAGLLSLYQLNFRQKDANGLGQMPQLQKLIGRWDIANIQVTQGGMIELSPFYRDDRITVTQSDFLLREKKVGLKYTIRSEKLQEDIRWLVKGPHSFRKL